MSRWMVVAARWATSCLFLLYEFNNLIILNVDYTANSRWLASALILLCTTFISTSRSQSLDLRQEGKDYTLLTKHSIHALGSAIQDHTYSLVIHVTPTFHNNSQKLEKSEGARKCWFQVF